MSPSVSSKRSVDSAVGEATVPSLDRSAAWVPTVILSKAVPGLKRIAEDARITCYFRS
jgi:hypothetical protein